MSQRLSRKSKKNQVEEIHVATGGLVARQDAHKRTSPHALTPPQKTTGNLPVEKVSKGIAKASPAFKEVPPSDLKNPEDQKKALAENTVDTKTEDKQ